MLTDEDAGVAILQRVRQLLQRGWCQRTYARDAAGRGVASYSDAAVRFCLVGAVRRASHDLDVGLEGEEFAFQRLAATLGGMAVEGEWGGGRTVWPWNDAPGRTQDEVLQLVEAAIGGK